MRGSLHEMEVQQARAGQIAVHKRRLEARKSLSKRGNITAAEALKRIKSKAREAATAKLYKAKKAVTTAENKAKEALRQKGVQARKDEVARKAYIKLYASTLGVNIPPEMWCPIRDPQKEPMATEKEALRASQSLYDAIAIAQSEFDTMQSNEPSIFTKVPIDPAVLEDEQQFLLSQRNPLNQVIIQLDEEEDEGSEGAVVTSPEVESVDDVEEGEGEELEDNVEEGEEQNLFSRR